MSQVKKTKTPTIGQIVLSRAKTARAVNKSSDKAILPDGKPVSGLAVPKSVGRSDTSRRALVAALDVGECASFAKELSVADIGLTTGDNDEFDARLKTIRANYHASLHAAIVRVTAEQPKSKFINNVQVQLWEAPWRFMLVGVITRVA